jgi:transposase, IS5 family
MYLVKSDKTLAHRPGKMYRKVSAPPTPPSHFKLPFEGKLSQDNRWVIMANLIPWNEFEEEYAQNFASEIGAPALPFRIALGGLIIKEKLGISDRETVEQIKENPYLQYFIGLDEYSNEFGVQSSVFGVKSMREGNTPNSELLTPNSG